ncbi:MAG: spore protease YyaC [Lachnospirales bacterium]
MINKKYIYNNDIKSFADTFSLMINKNRERENVFICIGTDKATGDCLGPLTGSILENLNIKNIYGTLKEPVHALNLEMTVENIYKNHINPFVIAIDASLGKYKNIGAINIWEGSLFPGSGISKKLIDVGDLSVTGIVNSYSLNGFTQLQNSRLSIVMDMAYIIGKGIGKVLNKY